jgi:hypothetical protein
MSRKIIGVTVGTMLPKPNFDQTDPSKGDYIKGDRSFLNMDNTLSIEGRPADAKATGDALNQLQTNIDEVARLVGDFDDGYYTEAEIDSMIDDLNASIDESIANKQDVLTGTEGQIVQFDEQGKPVAVDFNLEAITNETIDAICGGAISYAEDVMF